MTQKQKSKELLDRLKKWKENKEKDDELDEIINELESYVAPAGDEDGSNPPHGPGTPP